jgi:hypothetical protein
MHKADLADRGSAIARSVMNDIVSRGMLNPDSWYVMMPTNLVAPPVNTVFNSDGKYAPVINASQARGKFARPFALALREALNQPTAATDPTLIGRQFGSAYVIDPIGVSRLAFRDGQLPDPRAHFVATPFPASAVQAWGYYSYGNNWANSMWAPWAGSRQGALDPHYWPVRRVTFRQPSTGWQMDNTMAEHFFQGHDDLVTELPDRDDRPATQNWDITTVNGRAVPATRQWAGDYSWIVTVAPSTNAARDAMARHPESHAYDVSVVVFYKRPLPGDADDVHPQLGNPLGGYYNAMSEGERAVKATVISTGLNGGELLLERFQGEPTDPFDGLRSGQWIMLCGPHPNSTMSQPRFSLNWYQVLTIEGKGQRLNAQGSETPAPGANEPERRMVTLRGPEWPWRPGDPGSNNLCVAICRGAVAVHSKTIRLESPRGASSQAVAFGGGGNPNWDPAPFESEK